MRQVWFSGVAFLLMATFRWLTPCSLVEAF